MTQSTELLTQPQNIEAEKAVLGAMLLEKEAVGRALAILNKDNFYNSINADIFDAMVGMSEENKEIDPVTLSDKLRRLDKLERIGGEYFLATLSDNAPSAENVEHYAEIVLDKFMLRQMVSVAGQIRDNAMEGKDETRDIIERAEQAIFKIGERSLRGGFEQIKPTVFQILASLDSKNSGLIGVSSGFADLDKITAGFQKSDLIILAARPSTGKTSLALGMARNAAVHAGKSVGVFSLEMSKLQLGERLIGSEAEVDISMLRKNQLSREQRRKITNAADTIIHTKIYLDDTPGMNNFELRAKARRLKAQYGIDILFIDYLQLIELERNAESRQQEITKISRSLKQLAKELDIPIVCLSQLSRQVENRTKHRPILSDLRESGAIEQDADLVMFIYREFLYSEKEEDAHKAEIIIAKHRNGPIGNIELHFNARFTKFGNMAKEDFPQEDYAFTSELPE